MGKVEAIYCNCASLASTLPRSPLTATNLFLCAVTFSYMVQHFYSKTNQMHNISNLFYFGTTLYMFRTVCPSIIRSLYIQHQVYVISACTLHVSFFPSIIRSLRLYIQHQVYVISACTLHVSVFSSIIRSLRLYIQHLVYVIQVLWLLASKQPQNLYGMMLYVQS